MTRIQKTTVIFFTSWILVAIAYDIWAACQEGVPGTISWMVTWISQQWWGASITLAIGFLLGHFFGQDQPLSLKNDGG